MFVAVQIGVGKVEGESVRAPDMRGAVEEMDSIRLRTGSRTLCSCSSSRMDSRREEMSELDGSGI